ncbi:MAG: hypothetical protein ABL958_03045 [Bdellovibrionia bacterium]
MKKAALIILILSVIGAGVYWFAVREPSAYFSGEPIDTDLFSPGVEIEDDGGAVADAFQSYSPQTEFEKRMDFASVESVSRLDARNSENYLYKYLKVTKKDLLAYIGARREYTLKLSVALKRNASQKEVIEILDARDKKLKYILGEEKFKNLVEYNLFRANKARARGIIPGDAVKHSL